jgi:hypothetical protein
MPWLFEFIVFQSLAFYKRNLFSLCVTEIISKCTFFGFCSNNVMELRKGKWKGKKMSERKIKLQGIQESIDFKINSLKGTKLQWENYCENKYRIKNRKNVW